MLAVQKAIEALCATAVLYVGAPYIEAEEATSITTHTRQGTIVG
jgi:hypothetical protein